LQILVLFCLLEYQAGGVYLYKLLAKYLEELSGGPIENGCLDPTSHIDDLARVGTRFAQVTELPC
jgi:pyrimidine operon attenuation protein/uracil phosphoribosyltransferase